MRNDCIQFQGEFNGYGRTILTSHFSTISVVIQITFQELDCKQGTQLKAERKESD
jgi:hypothetical protein